MHGTLGHVVERLTVIEKDIRGDRPQPAPPEDDILELTQPAGNLGIGFAADAPEIVPQPEPDIPVQAPADRPGRSGGCCRGGAVGTRPLPSFVSRRRALRPSSRTRRPTSRLSPARARRARLRIRARESSPRNHPCGVRPAFGVLRQQIRLHCRRAPRGAGGRTGPKAGYRALMCPKATASRCAPR